MQRRVVWAASFLVLPLLVAAWPAGAQAPSVEDLIRDLKPRAGGTRGIRPVAPAAEAVPDVASPAAAAAPASAPGATPGATPGAAPGATPGATPGAAPGAGPAAVPAPASGAPAMASMQVQFESGSDRLTPGAMAELDKLGRALSGPELSAYRFRIEGHTDAVGGKPMNDALSARRAAAVVDYIARRYRIDRHRLSAVGMGFSQMAVPTPEGVAEPRNRRVQIVNLGV